MDPIARLTLEGGYDSNALYDGRGSDRSQRISPELGLRLRDHLWDLGGAYRGDWIRYDRIAPGGLWNHAAALSLDATPTRRLALRGTLRGSYAFDPIGLAMVGVFRTGRQSALLVAGGGRAEYRLARRVDVAGTVSERTVRFDDRTGGAMHQPGVEALYRATARISLGAAYQLGVFQGFDRGSSSIAFSNALRARARWRATRRIALEASAGPAAWSGPDGGAIVPEATAELVAASRAWGLRLTAAHGLGIGSTARPALVDALEFGGDRRFGRRWVVHADGGVWRSGVAPRGGETVTGWGVNGEAGVRVVHSFRLSLAASHFGRLDSLDPALRRTTVGLRVAWELPERR
ncbi:MAG TPA: hypothetical protein VFL83_15895 [Anaeromyxobacter sp.]|nr:hypothetical protein [Anaeromyxobacter sp.]